MVRNVEAGGNSPQWWRSTRTVSASEATLGKQHRHGALPWSWCSLDVLRTHHSRLHLRTALVSDKRNHEAYARAYCCVAVAA